jgi:glyoxylase-like metal-dependent hydrolase (beta-lactamase superfamily II)
MRPRHASSDRSILTVPLPIPTAAGTVNAYILDDDPLTIVDPGPRASASLDALAAGLTAIGRSFDDVGLMLLTHQHYDHVGAAAEIRRRSGASVAAIDGLAERMADYEAELRRESEFAVAVMRAHGVDESRVRAKANQDLAVAECGESVTVDRWLRDGDLVQLRDRELRVLSRPGHSPTDTLFVDETTRVAIVGDHVLVGATASPVTHRELGAGTEASGRVPILPTYLDGLARTHALGLVEILTGHGGTIRHPDALILRRREEHRERADRLHGLVGNGVQTADELVDALWPDVPAPSRYLAFSDVLGHIDLLVADGRVEARSAAHGVIFLPVR